jgi:hypothetical protein
VAARRRRLAARLLVGAPAEAAAVAEGLCEGLGGQVGRRLGVERAPREEDEHRPGVLVVDPR